MHQVQHYSLNHEVYHQEIFQEYLPKPVEFSRGGAKEIADLIGEMDADEAERYMQTLQNENSELYKAVKMLVLTFEDILEKFPDGILRDLM